MRPSEVSGVYALGVICVSHWIEAEDDLYDFVPIGAFGFRVEQAKIGHEMTAVIRGQLVAARRFVLKFFLRHRSPPDGRTYSRFNELLTSRRVARMTRFLSTHPPAACRPGIGLIALLGRRHHSTHIMARYESELSFLER
jgi:hypothetical protein